MKPWVITALISSVIMISTVAAYTHSLVYPRTEGEKLETRVSENRQDIKDLREEVRDEIRVLNSWLRQKE